jgi:serine/threonine protein kinase
MLRKGTKLHTAFEEYTCLAQIGQGGNGTVFKVKSLSGNVYALKAVDRAATTSDKLKRFKNELNFCYNCSHKNIVKVLDWGAEKHGDKELIFYVMPYYPSTLRIKMNEGLDAKVSVLAIFGNVLNAVASAHSKGVWHRDIKPENILIDDSGSAVLADFGIAHFSDILKVTAIKTRSSERLANFKYAAPEQRVEHAEIDARVDIYALGLLLNEMFTGKIISGTNYQRIGEANKEFAYLDSIVDRMICQRPSDRTYPADIIAKQILIAQTREQESKKLREILIEKPETDEEFQEIPVPIISGFDYKDSQLYVYLDNLDYKYHAIWFDVLSQAKYSYSSMMGYEPYKLRHMSPNTITMTVPVNIAKNVAGYISEWTKSATAVFNSQQRAEYERKKMESTRKQQADIERLRLEAKTREELQSMHF